jgi:recombination DNA repair RAD52 pathway protein
MALNSKQQEILLKGITTSRVASRRGGGGKSLSYLEAWDVKAHMIRMFGFAEWSWDVLSCDVAYAIEPTDTERNWKVGYKVVGRLTILATGATYTEAAVGMANLPDVGEAHDMAVKTAESDAFKRAAINLGDQFGLSLYKNGQTAPVVIATIGESPDVLDKTPDVNDSSEEAGA